MFVLVSFHIHITSIWAEETVGGVMTVVVAAETETTIQDETTGYL